MHIYEYLFAAIIIVAILISSSTMIRTISEPSSGISEKEQLKITAQKIMTQLLLDPGDPPEWGKDITINEANLKTFGLAKYSETTREAYVLDSDKVHRLDKSLLQLNNTSQLFISPQRVIDLLNLGHDYGFELKLYPALNVTVNKAQISDRYNITVTSEYGELPIVNANVTAKMYYYNASSHKINSKKPINEPPGGFRTGYNGNCTIDFGTIPTDMKVLSIVVDYYGIRVVKEHIQPEWKNVTRAHLIGDYLFLNQTYNLSHSVTEIIVNKKAGKYAIENVTFAPTKVGDGKYGLFVEPSTVAILAVSEDGTKLAFASREATLTYSTIPEVQSLPFAYSLERSVLISGSTYVMRLYIWRMSW